MCVCVCVSLGVECAPSIIIGRTLGATATACILQIQKYCWTTHKMCYFFFWWGGRSWHMEIVLCTWQELTLPASSAGVRSTRSRGVPPYHPRLPPLRFSHSACLISIPFDSFRFDSFVLFACNRPIAFPRFSTHFHLHFYWIFRHECVGVAMFCRWMLVITIEYKYKYQNSKIASVINSLAQNLWAMAST